MLNISHVYGPDLSMADGECELQTLRRDDRMKLIDGKRYYGI